MDLEPLVKCFESFLPTNRHCNERDFNVYGINVQTFMSGFPGTNVPRANTITLPVYSTVIDVIWLNYFVKLKTIWLFPLPNNIGSREYINFIFIFYCLIQYRYLNK